MNKLLSAILLSLTLGILPWWAGNASAAEFAVPHTFQGGGVVSADELNERLDNVEQQQKDFTAADLVGTWSCPSIVSYSSASHAGWVVSSDGLTMSTTITLTFTKTGGVLYVTGSTAPASYDHYCTVCGVTSGATQVINGKYLYPYGKIKKYSDTRFEFEGIRNNWFASSTTGSSGTSYTGLWAVCDKQNLPPLKPSGLAASASGTSITLTWTDNSTDETSFDIVRKDSASGTYAVVGNVTANTVTYTNTSVTTGTHWYRVIAKNANGSSLGSNVVKVTN